MLSSMINLWTMLHGENALRSLCWERHIHQTRHDHTHAASSCAFCVTHRCVHTLQDAAKQLDVEDDRAPSIVYPAVDGGWLPLGDNSSTTVTMEDVFPSYN